MALNHYAINQTVRGKMVRAARPMRFGRFGLLGVAGEMLKHRPRPAAKVQFNIATDRIVFEAFVKVHDGASMESVLLEEGLASKFHSTARKLGFHASAADMNRRLMNIRKNPRRYKAHGMILPDATKIAPHPSIVPRYAHIVEFSLARLRSQYGVTIDDILIDPLVAEQYEKMAQVAAPELKSFDLRLGALYVRKTRYISKNNQKIVGTLDGASIEAEFSDAGPLMEIRPASVPESEGMIELMESDRHLYISQNPDLRAALSGMATQSTLRFMANDFWRPDPATLKIRLFSGHQFNDVPISQWQLKLISDHKPVFNWPVTAA